MNKEWVLLSKGPCSNEDFRKEKLTTMIGDVKCVCYKGIDSIYIKKDLFIETRRIK